MVREEWFVPGRNARLTKLGYRSEQVSFKKPPCYVPEIVPETLLLKLWIHHDRMLGIRRKETLRLSWVEANVSRAVLFRRFLLTNKIPLQVSKKVLLVSPGILLPHRKVLLTNKMPLLVSANILLTCKSFLLRSGKPLLACKTPLLVSGMVLLIKKKIQLVNGRALLRSGVAAERRK